MRKIREVLRLKFEHKLSHRAISTTVGISKGSVAQYLKRAKEAEMSWERARGLDDAEVERRLFKDIGRNEPRKRAPIDFNWVHSELRKTGVTLQLLWLEYREEMATLSSRLTAYQYSQFCDLYAIFRKKVDVSMRQVHRAGEKMFIDYSGKKPEIYDRDTGECVAVELFVAVLGASNYTFAEATRTQRSADFCASTIRAFEYFDGVPQIVVPDQLRSAVKGPDRYDPEINPTYADLAEHYGTAIIPARPRRPKDKAKVENAVLVVQRWILACLRTRKFFSLDELNVAIAELLGKLNARPFKKLDGCRRSAYEAIDRPVLRPLPAKRFVIAEWAKATVNIDYHLEFDYRLYSVHHTLVGEKVEVCATAFTIEILHNRKRVASHLRSYGPKGTAVTAQEHRPKSHREYGTWPPSRVISWAESCGDAVGEVVITILKSKRHPEMGYRSCMALIRDTKRYSPDRVNAACRRALAIGSPTRKSIQMILKRGLDRVPVAEPLPCTRVDHDNVRGGAYFDRKEPCDD